MGSIYKEVGSAPFRITLHRSAPRARSARVVRAEVARPSCYCSPPLFGAHAPNHRRPWVIRSVNALSGTPPGEETLPPKDESK